MKIKHIEVNKTCLKLLSIQFSSVAQSCPTLCNPMDCSPPSFPILHHFLGFAQTHVHQVSDAIQPPHSLVSPSPAFNSSQHQGLFKWCGDNYMRYFKQSIQKALHQRAMIKIVLIQQRQCCRLSILAMHQISFLMILCGQNKM